MVIGWREVYFYLLFKSLSLSTLAFGKSRFNSKCVRQLSDSYYRYNMYWRWNMFYPTLFYNKSRSLLKNQRAVNGCNKMFLLCHYNISSCPEILITSRLILQRSINLKWIVNAGARWDWNYLLVVAIFSYFHLGINLGNFWDILWGCKS